MEIIELVLGAKEVQLCNKDGNLIALREYHTKSPVADAVRLLTRLLAMDYTQEVNDGH